MRRTISLSLVTLLAAGTLAGCSFGPQADPAAIKAAESYAEKLDAWAEKLAPAAAAAKTATSAEYDALTEGQDIPYEQTGIGAVLDEVPELKDFKADAVKATPGYLLAAEVEKRVGVIVEELRGLEPEPLDDHRIAVYESYFSLADIYYNTLGGPAADRRAADGRSADVFAEAEESTIEVHQAVDKIQRDASLAFLTQRSDIMDAALEELNGPSQIRDDKPLVPADRFGQSIGAFLNDWVRQEQAFLDGAVPEVEKWKAATDPYDAFWGEEFLNNVFSVPRDQAATLRPAFAAQVGTMADALTGSSLATPAPASPELPSPGDPYRQILLDGYLPWNDPGEGERHTTDRLWMLWHIRELEKTPDAAYVLARSAILEELNRSLEDGEPVDFRPSSGRVLALIQEYSEAFDPGLDATFVGDMHDKLVELRGFGASIRDAFPLLPEVEKDFDAVLAVIDEANADVEKAIADYEKDAKGSEEDPWREYELLDAVDELSGTYGDALFDAASPSLSLLDDDAQTEALIAEAVKGTAPDAVPSTASPTPTP